jgi:hypothetical protein
VKVDPKCSTCEHFSLGECTFNYQKIKDEIFPIFKVKYSDIKHEFLHIKNAVGKFYCTTSFILFLFFLFFLFLGEESTGDRRAIRTPEPPPPAAEQIPYSGVSGRERSPPLPPPPAVPGAWLSTASVQQLREEDRTAMLHQWVQSTAPHQALLFATPLSTLEYMSSKIKIVKRNQTIT